MTEQTGARVIRALKWAAGVITSTAVLAGAVAVAGDTRWAQIVDVHAWDSKVLQRVQYSADQTRKQMLEDKIYEINLIPEHKRTDQQRAMLDRFNRQANELSTRWNRPPAE